MPTRIKIGKKRLDKYYHLAKEQGFRARSAFKLIQINQKYDFLSGCNSIVDLCCAPGSWLQVARQHNIKHIIGVDITPCKPIQGVQTIVGDITHDNTAKQIYSLVEGDVDVVLCDGAPNVGTCWSKDAFEQNALILASVEITSKILRRNGTFLTKVFRSKDYFNLLWVLNQLFEDVTCVKPLASRDNSAEVFLLCKNYKKPAKIDANFFDQNQIFKEQVVTEDFYKVMKFSDFFKHTDPKNVLTTYTKIIIDVHGPLFDKIYDHTTKIYFNDLQQLSNHDIKKILKKREKLIKYLENGEHIDGLDLPIKEKVESIEIPEEEKKLLQIEREKKKKARAEKKFELQRKIRLGQSKIFQNLSSVDAFFDDKIFKNSFSNEMALKPMNEPVKPDLNKPSEQKDEISSDEEEFNLDSDDRRLLVEMKNDKEAFEERAISRFAMNDMSKLPKFYTEEQEVNKIKPFDDGIKYEKINKKEKEVFNRRVRRALKFKKELLEEIKDENDQPKRLLKTCMKKRNNKPKVVVSSKGRRAHSQKGRVLYVDRRMKKDLRKQKARALRNK
ncbi:putative SAM-dependent rRNA methyltransferase SPB1 [Pseudoloma neurophilia]|uniref:Putative SAM-dependent rRNA methyltransferase SPB1 n=1 Tax=Pseudoloma neurophilia TaxID=146866 RepID=A0A0R0M7K9_9MICR|nr:putative SAM-dependent rRNA methyltransferase SPB1 [Pseudoloma neurophilia]